MPRYDIQLEIAPGLDCPVRAKRVQHVIAAVLMQQSVTPGAVVWVRLGDDTELAELNETYRDVQGPTDVLSFPTESDDEWITAPDAPRELGDIVISWPRVVAQAAEEPHSADDELALLLVHGCLHLLGYDHLEEGEKARMWAEQQAILAQLGISVRVD